MARNIRWFVEFKSRSGVNCRVNIYDNDWPAGVTMGLRGAADPFYYEEDDSDDLLNDVMRFRTGYIRLVEQSVGELDAIYPSSKFDRYVEFFYGGKLEFNGYIQVQDFSRTLETLSTNPTDQCVSVVEFPVISPAGLFGKRTFTPTPFNPPTTVTLGSLLDIVMDNGVYEKVTFPNIAGTGFDKTIFSLVVCPFNDNYHHSMTSAYMDKMFAPQTYAYIIEAICKAYGWICHDTPKALIFTSFDYKTRYVNYPVSHIGESGYLQDESIDQVAEALSTYFYLSDDKARMSTLLPESGIGIDYEGDDGNPDFTFDRTYFNGVEMIDAQDPRELTSICNLLAPLQLHEVTGCGSLSFDSSGKVNIGTGIVAWNGKEGVLISFSNSWADGRELFSIRLYRKMLSNYSFSVNYDIMTSDRNIAALATDTSELALAHFSVTVDIQQDYIDAHFFYHYGQTIQGGTLLPLPDNFLTLICNISLQFYINGEPYASYKYLPASKGDTIPSSGYPAISSTVNMPISLYRANERMIGDSLLTTKVTEYPYLFNKRKELVGKFRLSTTTAPDLLHTRLFTFIEKKWRVIAQTFHPWDDEYELTLQHSLVLDTVTYNILATAANTSLDGYSDTVNAGTPFNHHLYAVTGYVITSVVITMGGVDVTSSVYDSTTGQISIAGVTGNVSITAVAEALPYDAEVEYLQSDGTAYINLMNTLNSDTDVIDIDFRPIVSITAACGVFGARNGASSKNFSVLDSSTNTIGIDVNNGSYSTYRVMASTSAVNVRCLVHAEKSNKSIKYDGVQVASSTTSSQSFTTDGAAYLFATNGFGSLTPIILYSFQWRRNGDLLFDLIPVRKNGVGYMYDKVSGQLFGNAGSGSFSYGNDKT